MTFLVWRQEGLHVKCSPESLPLVLGITVCVNQTWQLFTLTGWDERFWLHRSGPAHLREWERRQTKQEKGLYIFIFWAVSDAFLQQAHRCARKLTAAMCVCAESEQKHTHTAANTAAGLWCSRCCICCACLSSQIIPSTGSKTWKQRQTTYSKSVKRHICCFMLAGLRWHGRASLSEDAGRANWQRLPQEAEVREAASLHLCQQLSSSQTHFY